MRRLLPARASSFVLAASSLLVARLALGQPAPARPAPAPAAPATTTAPARPPAPATASPTTPAPAAAVEEDDPDRIQKLGDARYTPGGGLVRKGDPPPPPPKTVETPGPVTVSPRDAYTSGGSGGGLKIAGSPLRMTLGFSYYKLKPDGGETGIPGDGMDTSGLQMMLNLKQAFPLFSRFTLGLVYGGAIGRSGNNTAFPDLGLNDPAATGGNGHPIPIAVWHTSLWAQLRLNMYLGPITVGGIGGYRLDHYKPSVSDPANGTALPADLSEGKQEVGPEYGGYVSIGASSAYLEGAMLWRKGEYLTGRYARLQLVFPDPQGGVSFWYEWRLDTKGAIPAEEITTAGRHYAFSMPATAMFGIGFGGSGW